MFLLFVVYVIILLSEKGFSFVVFPFWKEGKMLFVRPLTPEEEKELPQRLQAATNKRTTGSFQIAALGFIRYGSKDCYNVVNDRNMLTIPFYL